jgi:hypothetical protein
MLIEHEVIVFSRSEISFLDPQPAGHAEVKAERAISGKIKPHPLSTRFRSQEPRACEMLAQRSCIRAAKNALFGVQKNFDNATVHSGVPATPKIFDFR